MKGNSVLLVLIFYSLFLFLGESRSSLTPQSKNDNQVYIVYMGAAHSANGSLREDHAHILNTVLKRYLINWIEYIYHDQLASIVKCD